MSISNKFENYMNSWRLKRFWKSKKGIALVHKVFDTYKNSYLFTERCRYFGSIESAKMFSMEEFNHFKNKVMNDKESLFTIMREPDKIIDELIDKDTVLKGHVKLSTRMM